MSDAANQQSTSKMASSLISNTSNPDLGNPNERVLEQISSMMKRILTKKDNIIRLTVPEKPEKFVKRVQITNFLFEPEDNLQDDKMISYHRECVLRAVSGAAPSSQTEPTDTLSSLSDNSGGGSDIVSKSDEDEMPIETMTHRRPSRRPVAKKGVTAELEEKLEEAAVAQSIIRRLRNAGSALMEMGPEYYKKSCYSYHFQEVRRRLIRLIGRPAIRINDHAAMRELQMALEKEAEEEAEAHERRLAEAENKRIQALILTGVLDTSALKRQKFTDADRSDQPASSSVTIKSRSEDESHLDFRRYTRNPTAAKYNVLHIAEKVDKMSSDPIEPRAKWKDVKPHVTCEGQTNNLLGETAYMLQEVLESDGGLKREDTKKGIGKSGRRINIPRMSFAESRLKAKEIGATGAVIGVQELYETAESFVKQTDFLKRWPREMRECFAAPDSYENIPHLNEYSYQPREDNY